MQRSADDIQHYVNTMNQSCIGEQPCGPPLTGFANADQYCMRYLTLTLPPCSQPQALSLFPCSLSSTPLPPAMPDLPLHLVAQRCCFHIAGALLCLCLYLCLHTSQRRTLLLQLPNDPHQLLLSRLHLQSSHRFVRVQSKGMPAVVLSVPWHGMARHGLPPIQAWQLKAESQNSIAGTVGAGWAGCWQEEGQGAPRAAKKWPLPLPPPSPMPAVGRMGGGGRNGRKSDVCKLLCRKHGTARWANMPSLLGTFSSLASSCACRSPSAPGGGITAGLLICVVWRVMPFWHSKRSLDSVLASAAFLDHDRHPSTHATHTCRFSQSPIALPAWAAKCPGRMALGVGLPSGFVRALGQPALGSSRQSLIALAGQGRRGEISARASRSTAVALLSPASRNTQL